MSQRPQTANQVSKVHNPTTRTLSTRVASSNFGKSFSRRPRASCNFARIVQITSNDIDGAHVIGNMAQRVRPETANDPRPRTHQLTRFTSAAETFNRVGNETNAVTGALAKFTAK